MAVLESSTCDSHNILATPKEDILQLRSMGDKLKLNPWLHPPAVLMVRAIVESSLMTRWVHHKLIDWPTECATNTSSMGVVTQAVTATANVVRRALSLPLQNPWTVICGPTKQAC